jgi:uridylate kinase
MSAKNTVGRTIISLGGSLFVPDNVDVDFLRAFKKIIEERVALGERFAIIVGGGKVARNYMQAGYDLAALPREQMDWIGIYTTRLNAEFMRIVFGTLAHGEIVMDPTIALDVAEPVIFGAGWKPGCSTDHDAVLMAGAFGAQKLLNLSNTNYVYDKDPRTNPDAQALPSLTWDQYRALIPAEWTPGLSTPFDPIASKEAQSLGLEVMIINGTKLQEVEKCLRGEAFDGSTIRG